MTPQNRFGRQLSAYLATWLTDVGETADALHRALTMPVEERRQMQTALRRVVRENPPSTWVGRQVEDLERAAAPERS